MHWDTFKQDDYSTVGGDVGLARCEPALLPPCLTKRALSYSNCQESNPSISKWIFRNLALYELTDTRFKDKIINMVFEVSWRTQTMIRPLDLEDHNRRRVFFACMILFLCNFLAEPCTINVLYGSSNLPCKINQHELAYMNQVWVWVLSQPSLARVIQTVDTWRLYHECKIW